MLTKFLWLGKTVNLTGDNINISSNNFNVDKNGNMSCSNANITGGTINIKDNSSSGTTNNINMTNRSNNNIKSSIGSSGFNFESYNSTFQYFNPLSNTGMSIFSMSGGKNGTAAWQTNINMQCGNGNNDNSTGITITDKNVATTTIRPNEIRTPKVTQTSMATDKKNFEKIEDNAIEIIKATDIYKYNLKSEKDTDKKHIGFVIGNKYNYSKEITAVDEAGNEIGVDNYAMTSVCFKAIQEQQEIIEQLQEEIKKLKEEK